MISRPSSGQNIHRVLPFVALTWVACGGGVPEHTHPLGSVDADLLDGLDSTDLSLAEHTHVQGSVDADLLDGLDSSDLSLADHTHVPVLWVGSSLGASFLEPVTYVADVVEVDTTAGHLTMAPDGLTTVNTAGIYRVRTWGVVDCASILEAECVFVQTLLRNGARVEGSTGTVFVLSPQAGLKLDATYIGSFAVGDTFSVEYDCSLDDAPFGTNQCAIESGADGGNGLQIEYLGSP